MFTKLLYLILCSNANLPANDYSALETQLIKATLNKKLTIKTGEAKNR